MGQFDKREWFEFNGFNSYGRYVICTRGTSDNTTQFGINRSVEKETTSNGTSVLKKVVNNNPTVEFTITKIGINGDIDKFNKNDFEELNRVFFSVNEFKPLVIDDEVYYVLFISSNSWRIDNKGTITLVAEMRDGYFYSNVMDEYIEVSGSKELEIYNRSTACEYLNIDIKIKMLQGNSIIIENLTTNQKMTISGMENNEIVYIYNDDLKQVKSLIDNNRNLFKLFNKVWIKLRQGRNNLKITCDKCEIDFIYQSKMGLY